MALVPLYLIIFLTSLLHFVAAQQTNGSVSVSASLTATPDAKPWLSSSGEFAFGFKQIQGKDNFLLSIWYDKIPEKTIIWYPEGGPTVSTGSKVDLVDKRGLVLSDPRGKEVMVRGGVINSKMDKTNFAGGRFQLRMLQDGNLVLNTLDMFSGSAGEAYYISRTLDGSNSTNSGFQLVFDETGYMYILRRNGERFDLTVRGSLPSGDYYHRATLDSDGVFTQYYHPKNEGTSWRVIWFVPENICTTKDSKACGLNNVCSFDDNRPNCECPLGFSLLDPNTPYGDCKPDFTPSCDEGESNHGGDVLDFIELNNIDWPFSDYVHMNPSNEQTCRTSCLNDCFCAVAVYRDNQCWKKQLPLNNGFKDTSNNVKAFLKFRKTDGPSRTGENKSGTGENTNRRTWILGGSVLLSTSVLGIVLLISVIYVCFFQIHCWLSAQDQTHKV
ncbi:putative non-specific serine/threonine protein kinase [Helianthus annuus]|uniref:Putative S-locus glycoprotein domain, Bulb-type lectin domain protein n=1 Tax=Helianthus annuus TaxID=4232 RepID=A0A251VQC9_HELAN|nr:G-type lectin S-receptor-like serine/threonine-protein kinase LECRK2 [Helianthus annuus]KAJ0627662.1 putative non-specific serine/threonine protein kinase [Helianthus annuus]KAJ0783961.1 putative non-specific serine/threonine protein kinase [Helianthus annuus]KAJ0948907.1 putative non-specific serine/threonine protein kinase [Helianthus annuus]